MRAIHVLVFILLVLNQGFAQPTTSCNVNGGEHCFTSCYSITCVVCHLSDLEYIKFKLPDFFTFDGPSPICTNGTGGVSNNSLWIPFIANTDTYTITISPLNCQEINGTIGMQAAIYDMTSDCEVAEYLACSADCPNENPITLTASGLTIGKVYYLFLDGCAGSVCEFYLEVLNPEPYYNGYGKPNINGDTVLCKGDVGIYTLDIVDDCSVIVNWCIDSIEIAVDDYIEIEFTAPGVYELCAKVSYTCGQSFMT